MATGDIPKSPNVFHPTKPSAVGSRNSLYQDGRNQKTEFTQVLKDEADMILGEIKEKLPPEVLQELDVMGGLKEKLYNYFNQNYQNMFNRYITTTEDEMVKKIRGFVDREETKILARYTPKEIAQILDQVGGADKFNTGEIEKSIVNMYGHLQGHVQRGMNDLENETNAMLRQKEDVGAFVRGENAYSVVKCAFKDNLAKPKTVTDAKLSVNILDTELVSPIFQYQISVEFLIKDQISKTVMDTIDRTVATYQDQRVDEGGEELTDSELMFERIKRVPEFTDDDVENPDSKRYALMAKELIQKIEGLRAEISSEDFDPMNVRENIKKIIDTENIRNRGFNTAINNITSILDTSKMGYQYIENLKNARELVLREYEDTDVTQLPDERYQISMKFYDSAQLANMRQAYDTQMEEFRKEIVRVWDDSNAVYYLSRKRGINDYEDLSRKLRGVVKKQIKDVNGDPLYDEAEKVWNEILRIKAEETDIEKLNRTCLYEKDLLKKMLRKSKDRIQSVFGYENPKERVFLDGRITHLLKEFEEFDYMINPYHIQPGLVLDVDITSLKRKKYTLRSMANVLNEFLNSVSKGFQDAAFASFKRRRSTVKSDLEMSFASVEAPGASSSPARSESGGSAPSKPTAASSRSTGTGRSGKADVTPKRKSKIDVDELSEL